MLLVKTYISTTPWISLLCPSMYTDGKTLKFFDISFLTKLFKKFKFVVCMIGSFVRSIKPNPMSVFNNSLFSQKSKLRTTHLRTRIGISRFYRHCHPVASAKNPRSHSRFWGRLSRSYIQHWWAKFRLQFTKASRRRPLGGARDGRQLLVAGLLQPPRIGFGSTLGRFLEVNGRIIFISRCDMCFIVQ